MRQNRSRTLPYLLSFLMLFVLAVYINTCGIHPRIPTVGTVPETLPVPTPDPAPESSVDGRIGVIEISDNQVSDRMVLVVEKLDIPQPAWIAVYEFEDKTSGPQPRMSRLRALQMVEPGDNSMMEILLTGPGSERMR